MIYYQHDDITDGPRVDRKAFQDALAKCQPSLEPILCNEFFEIGSTPVNWDMFAACKKGYKVYQISVEIIEVDIEGCHSTFKRFATCLKASDGTFPVGGIAKRIADHLDEIKACLERNRANISYKRETRMLTRQNQDIVERLDTDGIIDSYHFTATRNGFDVRSFELLSERELLDFIGWRDEMLKRREAIKDFLATGLDNRS